MDPREVGDLVLQGDGIVVVIVSEHRDGKGGMDIKANRESGFLLINRDSGTATQESEG